MEEEECSFFYVLLLLFSVHQKQNRRVDIHTPTCTVYKLAHTHTYTHTHTHTRLQSLTIFLHATAPFCPNYLVELLHWSIVKERLLD